MEMRKRYFRVVIQGLEKKLLIPQNFARQIADNLSEVALLVDPSGSTWHVKFNRTTDGTYLEDGWEIFSIDHSLSRGECLLFEYFGNLKFTVMIYAPSTMLREDCFVGNSSQELAQCGGRKRHTEFSKARGTKGAIDKEVPFSSTSARSAAKKILQPLKLVKKDPFLDSVVGTGTKRRASEHIVTPTFSDLDVEIIDITCHASPSALQRDQTYHRNIRAKTRRSKKTETPSSAFHTNQGKKKASSSFPEDDEEIFDDLMFFSYDHDEQGIPSSMSPTAVQTEPETDYVPPPATSTPSIIPDGTPPAPSRKSSIDRKRKQKVGKVFSGDQDTSKDPTQDNPPENHPMVSQFWRWGDKKEGPIDILDTVADPETAVGVLHGSVLPGDKHKIEGLADLEEVKNLSSVHLASFNSLFVGLWDRVASERRRVEEFADLATAKESLEKQVAELTQELEEARKSVMENQQHKLRALKWELRFNDADHDRKKVETIKNYLQSENQSLKGELDHARSNLAALRKEIRESMSQQAQELESPRMGNTQASDELAQNDDETSFT
ncbi:hypothetical protein AQUCO_00900848v1 [Aquilegia coerulea]|uniref:TF-B3 domain-containing protein n=1 Tax=Aquilegia coerulea TaxID=218851 RepID=A0A2G5EFM6_AQUCA|nr:hypothetical protein AQUCO_00900848v1 [Aquilegia coerulea]